MKAPELRVVIVDDEAPAREVLLDLLSEHSNVKVVGEADSVANAMTLCQDLRPNLVFLDIEMRDGEGFDLLTKLTQNPGIIFVTAHDQFGARAFNAHAIDYLLKPVNPDRLTHALERINHEPKSKLPDSRSQSGWVARPQFCSDGPCVNPTCCDERCQMPASSLFPTSWSQPR